MLTKIKPNSSVSNSALKSKPSVEAIFKTTSAGTIAKNYESNHNSFNGSCHNQEIHHNIHRKYCDDHRITQDKEHFSNNENHNHACGDHIDSTFKSINTVPNSVKSDVIIQYKNVCFQESESSEHSSDELYIADICERHSSAITRPIFCPISRCSKVVTPESILQHFCFEHSKTPKIHLEVEKSCYLKLFSNKLTSDSICLAVFLKQTGKRSNKLHKANSTFSFSSVQKYKDINPVFLMVSKISMAQKKNEENYTSDDFNKRSSHVESYESLLFKENEILLLWISELNHLPKTYKITISSDDRKHSHSYTGNSIHIKKNDAFSVYETSECLAVNGKAANRLINDEMSMQVSLKAIKYY